MAPGDTSPRYGYLGVVTWDEGHRPGRLHRDRQDGELLFTVPVSLLPVGTSPEEAIRWFRQRMSIPGWAPSASRSPPNDRDPKFVFGLPDSAGAWEAVRNLDFEPGPALEGDDDSPPRLDASP